MFRYSETLTCRNFFHRVFIVTILPIIISYKSQNFVNDELAELLHENNLAAPTNSEEDCQYLKEFVHSWLLTAESVQPDSPLLGTNAYLLWAQILPYRCPSLQDPNGIITLCNSSAARRLKQSCQIWQHTAAEQLATEQLSLNNLAEYFADVLDIRVGGIHEVSLCLPDSRDPTKCIFETRVLFNDNFTVSFT